MPKGRVRKERILALSYHTLRADVGLTSTTFSTGNVVHVTLDTRPSRFSHATWKRWEGLETRLVDLVSVVLLNKPY